MRRGNHYHLYVIELSSAVLQEPLFMRANLNYVTGKPWVAAAAALGAGIAC